MRHSGYHPFAVIVLGKGNFFENPRNTKLICTSNSLAWHLIRTSNYRSTRLFAVAGCRNSVNRRLRCHGQWNFVCDVGDLDSQQPHHRPFRVFNRHQRTSASFR